MQIYRLSLQNAEGYLLVVEGDTFSNQRQLSLISQLSQDLLS